MFFYHLNDIIRCFICPQREKENGGGGMEGGDKETLTPLNFLLDFLVFSVFYLSKQDMTSTVRVRRHQYWRKVAKNVRHDITIKCA